MQTSSACSRSLLLHTVQAKKLNDVGRNREEMLKRLYKGREIGENMITKAGRWKKKWEDEQEKINDDNLTL